MIISELCNIKTVRDKLILRCPNRSIRMKVIIVMMKFIINAILSSSFLLLLTYSSIPYFISNHLLLAQDYF